MIVEIPVCTNPRFNGDVQLITNEPKVGYTIFDNNQKYVSDDYKVTASLHSGFVWEDGTTEDKTLKCAITPLTYKVVYNGNGHTGGSMEASVHTYGVSQKLTENKFTKKGYSFVGWSTKSDGNVEYTDKLTGEKLIDPKTENEEIIINLYAIWKLTHIQ